MAHQVFQIVAEDIEKQHVPDQVHPAAMQEHMGEQPASVDPLSHVPRHQTPFAVKRAQLDLAA